MLQVGLYTSLRKLISNAGRCRSYVQRHPVLGLMHTFVSVYREYAICEGTEQRTVAEGEVRFVLDRVFQNPSLSLSRCICSYTHLSRPSPSPRSSVVRKDQLIHPPQGTAPSSPIGRMLSFQNKATHASRMRTTGGSLSWEFIIWVRSSLNSTLCSC